MAFFGPGDIFGEVAVFEDKPYPASAQATESTTVLAVGKDHFTKFLSRYPAVALKIINMLGSRLATLWDVCATWQASAWSSA